MCHTKFRLNGVSDQIDDGFLPNKDRHWPGSEAGRNDRLLLVYLTVRCGF